MRQLFSAYPAGFAGFALLLLRGSLALFLMAGLAPGLAQAGWLAMGTCALVALTTAGVYTRAAALLGVADALFTLHAAAEPARALLLTHVLDALALTLLGPGAFSLDARLFGRSTISL